MEKIFSGTLKNLSIRIMELVRRRQPGSALSAPAVGKRVIVATGQDATDEVIGGMLTSAGYKVKTTEHPSEVPALVANFRPRIVLVGLIMRELDGVKLSLALSPRFPDLKIILADSDVEERILRHLLDRGVSCDTLEWPFEREEFLEMMSTWLSGSDYVDSTTRLRDGHQFRLALTRKVGNKPWQNRSPSIIVIELFHPSRTGESQLIENSILARFGALLAQFADGGSAYRYSPNEYALILPATSKREASDAALRLNTEIRDLVDGCGVGDSCFPAIGVVSIPDDAQSVEQIVEAKSQLMAAAKRRSTGGVEVCGEGAIALTAADYR